MGEFKNICQFFVEEIESFVLFVNVGSNGKGK